MDTRTTESGRVRSRLACACISCALCAAGLVVVIDIPVLVVFLSIHLLNGLSALRIAMRFDCRSLNACFRAELALSPLGQRQSISRGSRRPLCGERS